MLINLLKRRELFQTHGLRRSGQAEQIVATSGRFATPIPARLPDMPVDVGSLSNPAFSHRVSANVADKVPGIEENGAAGDSLAIALSNNDAGDQRLDAARFVAAELAMRDIKPGSLPQGMSKEQWKIGNIIPAWKRREPTLKLGFTRHSERRSHRKKLADAPLGHHAFLGSIA